MKWSYLDRTKQNNKAMKCSKHLLPGMLLFFFLITAMRSFGQDYAYASRVLDRWTVIMDHFTGKMAEENDLEILGKYCIELADSLKAIAPALRDLMDHYPDLTAEEPPEVARASIDKNKKATESFSKLLGLLTRKANENADNEPFQQAFATLNRAMYEMYR